MASRVVERALDLDPTAGCGKLRDIHIFGLVDLRQHEMCGMLELGHEIDATPKAYIIGQHGSRIGDNASGAEASRYTEVPQDIIVL